MQFLVTRMACGGCAKAITNAIMAVDPSAKVETDTVAKTVKVNTSVSSAEIGKALEAAGYPATAV